MDSFGFGFFVGVFAGVLAYWAGKGTGDLIANRFGWRKPEAPFDDIAEQRLRELIDSRQCALHWRMRYVELVRKYNNLVESAK